MRYFWRESFTFSFPVLTIFRSAFFSASAQTISVLVFVAVSLCEAFGVGEGGGEVCSYFPSLRARQMGVHQEITMGKHGTLPAFLYQSLLELDSLEVH